MSQTTNASVPNLFPCLRYTDGEAAIEWLARAFGFEKVVSYPGPDGTIAHAELAFGPGTIMLGSMKEDRFGFKSPREAGGVTSSICVYLVEVDAHCERARAAGAEIVQPIEDTDYGARGYTARDLEGHLWHFSNYLPEKRKE